jgi:hypothetical protein
MCYYVGLVWDSPKSAFFTGDFMNKDNLEELALCVAGGCDDQLGEEYLTERGLDPDDLAEYLAKIEIFCCPNCCWWGHSGELLEHENSIGGPFCADCYEAENDSN